MDENIDDLKKRIIEKDKKIKDLLKDSKCIEISNNLKNCESKINDFKRIIQNLKEQISLLSKNISITDNNLSKIIIPDPEIEFEPKVFTTKNKTFTVKITSLTRVNNELLVNSTISYEELNKNIGKIAYLKIKNDKKSSYCSDNKRHYLNKTKGIQLKSWLDLHYNVPTSSSFYFKINSHVSNKINLVITFEGKIENGFGVEEVREFVCIINDISVPYKYSYD